MEEQTLELQLRAKADEAIKALDSLTNKLTGVDKSLSSINKTLGKTDGNKARTEMDKLADSTDKASKKAEKLKSALNLGAVAVALNKVGDLVKGALGESIDYSENLNLFNVALDDLSEKGMKFQNTINEAFGTNQSSSLYFQGIFQAMSKSMGIANDSAYTLSEGLVKVGYDLASLYNISDESAMKKLRAGLAGQTEPLRTVGMDITENSLKPVIEKLNLTNSEGELRTPRELNYAEKMLLRYISIMEQASVVQGDFANTIEAPANQLKILAMQASEAKRALGNLFIGAFARILPYANAILMVIKEVANAIAGFFGIKVSDYNSSIAEIDTGFSDASDSVGDIDSGLGGATKKAKELKRQLLGFDQVNNITENKDTGSSGGSGGSSVGGGIDQRLLDALKNYENGMEKVRMKATKIKEAIMDWLKLLREHPLEAIAKLAKNIWEWFSKLSPLAKILVTLGLVGGINNLIKAGKKLLNLLGLGGLTGGVSKLIAKTKDLKTLKVSTMVTTTGSKLLTLVKTVGKVSLGFGGLVTALVGAGGVYSSMKKMTKETEYSGEQQKKYTASVLATAGGATVLGAVIGGPLGAAIGGLTGAVVAGVSAWAGYKKGIEEVVDSRLFGDLNVSTEQWLEMMNASGTGVSDFRAKTEEMKSTLESLCSTFEENYDALGMYGLKFGTLGLQISETDAPLIKKAIEDMCNSTSDMIKTQTDYDLQLWSKSFEGMTNVTEEEQKAILNSVHDYGKRQQTELSTTQNNITATYDKAIAERGYLTEEEKNYIETQLNKIKELTTNAMSTAEADMVYYKTRIAGKSLELDEESYGNLKKARDKFQEEQEESISEHHAELINSAERRHAENVRINGENEQEYKKYQKELGLADEWRENQIKETQKTIDGYMGEAIASLKARYKELEGKTDEFSTEERDKIMNIFKELDVDTSDLNRTFSTAGRTAADKFSSDLKSNLVFDPSNVYSGVNGMYSKLSSSATSAKFSMPKATTGSYSTMKFSYQPIYANGGFPEEGPFFMNRGEIAGKFSNGKGVVANNYQITEGIKRAVVEGMAEVMGTNNGRQGVTEIRVHADKGIIVETAVDGIQQHVKQTGMLPFTVPAN